MALIDDNATNAKDDIDFEKCKTPGVRTDNDIDSITFGSATKQGQVKIYLNTRKDDENDLLPRIDLAIAGLNYMKKKMGDSQ